MKEITELFEKKLKPAIRPALEARNGIAEKLKQNSLDQQNFAQLSSSAEDTIKKLEADADARIISGKPADDLASKIAAKKVELEAFRRHLAKLDQTSADLSTQLQNANRDLSNSLGQALDALRGDVQALISDALLKVLEICVSFENAGRAEEAFLGVELARDKEQTVFRFPSEGCFRDLDGYLSPIGEDLSAIRRREVRQAWAMRK